MGRHRRFIVTRLAAPTATACAAFGLDAPYVETIEVFHFVLFAGPLAATQTEVNPHLVAGFESIDRADAIAGQLEQHKLRILRFIAELKHELALLKSIGDLFGLEDGV